MDRAIASESAAMLLVGARGKGVRLRELPETCRPRTIDEALAIQRDVTRLAGERIGGWKCGTPVDDMILAAPIYESAIVSDIACPVHPENSFARVEPEIAYVLARDLPARKAAYGSYEILSAVAHTRLAMELVGCRYCDSAKVTFPELLADNLFNDGLLMGPLIPLNSQAIPSAFQIEVSNADKAILVRDGSHRDHDPSLPLCWLANFLSQNGEGLKARQVVITGSYAGVLELPTGTRLNIRFGELGTLHVQFEESTQGVLE